jgi:hypothetical protein
VDSDSLVVTYVSDQKRAVCPYWRREWGSLFQTSNE